MAINQIEVKLLKPRPIKPMDVGKIVVYRVIPIAGAEESFAVVFPFQGNNRVIVSRHGNEDNETFTLTFSEVEELPVEPKSRLHDLPADFLEALVTGLCRYSEVWGLYMLQQQEA